MIWGLRMRVGYELESKPTELDQVPSEQRKYIDCIM